MSCLSPARIAQIKARIAAKQLQLTAADALLDELLKNPYQMSRFDSGEGSQQSSQKRLIDVQKTISTLESEINRLEAKLARKGIVNMNMRRGSRCR